MIKERVARKIRRTFSSTTESSVAQAYACYIFYFAKKELVCLWGKKIIIIIKRASNKKKVGERERERRRKESEEGNGKRLLACLPF